MKKVLIAGGAGYLGTRICNTLHNQYDITIIDHFWFGDYVTDNVKKIKGDIVNLQPKDVEQYDAVIFLGGLSNDPMALYRPDRNFIENSSVSTYLAFISKQAGVKRFIGASSCSVYGFTKNRTLTETSEVKPTYPYGIAKLQFERGAMLLEDENFKPIVFRKGTVGGWSEKMRYDLVVNTMLMTAFTKNKLIVNSPTLWRPLIDIRDVVEGYRLAIEADLSISGVYNLTESNHTIGSLGQIIRDQLKLNGYDIPLELLSIEDVRNYKVSNDKIKDDLWFQPKYTPADSIQEILDNIDINTHNFLDEKYYCLDTFKRVL